MGRKAYKLEGGEMHLNLKCKLPTLGKAAAPASVCPGRPPLPPAQPARALNDSPSFGSHVAESRGYEK